MLLRNKKAIILIVIGTLMMYTCLFFGARFLFHGNRKNNYLSNTLYYRAPDVKDVDIIPDTTTMYVRNELLFTADETLDRKKVQQIVKKDKGKIVGYVEKPRVYQIRYEDDVDYERLSEIRQKLSALDHVASVMLNVVIDRDGYEGRKNGGRDWAGEVTGLKPNESKQPANILSNNPSGFDKQLIDGMTGTNTEQLANKQDQASMMEYLVSLSYLVTKDDNSTAVVDVSVSMNDLRYAASHGDETARKILSDLNNITTDVLKGLREEHDYVIVKSTGDDAPGYDISKKNISSSGQEDVDALMAAYIKGGYLPALSDEDYETFMKEAEKLEKEKELTASQTKMLALYYLYKTVGDEKPHDMTSDVSYDFLSGIKDEDVNKHIVVVGAAADDGTYASFAAQGKRCDLAAPGDDIHIPLKDGVSEEGYSSSAFASAYVTALLIQVLNENDTLTGEQLKALLMRNTGSRVFYDDKQFVRMINALEVLDAAKGNQEAVPEITTSTPSMTLYVNEEKPIKTNIDNVYYQSNDMAIASVTVDGVVRGNRKGTTKVIAYKGDKKVEVEVNVIAPTLKLSSDAVEVVKSKSETIKAEVKGLSKDITWSSDDEQIATVKDGKITGVEVGKTTVTATANGISKKVKVTVIRGRLTLSDKSVTLEKGKTKTVKATVEGESKTVTWKSSDSSVATVNDGVIKGVKEGRATITAEANGVTQTVSVTVENGAAAFKKLKPTFSGHWTRRSHPHADGWLYTCRWNAVKGADGYEVRQGSKSYGISWYYKTYSTSSRSTSVGGSDIEKLSAQVRAYKRINGKKVYSQWSKVMTGRG